MFKNFKKTQFLKKDLVILDEYIKSIVKDMSDMLSEVLASPLLTGGKRIRPALFLICAKNDKYDIGYLLPAAAGIEILHTASLIHDDIIDNSFLRRGNKTIHNIYDKDTARYAGDYLFTYAFYLLNSYSNHLIHKEMSNTSQSLVMGEFDQLKTKSFLEQSEKVYLEKINEKTSSLFKLSCVLGGILSGSEEKDIENMRKFGGFLGMAFQINDDLIDININKPADKVGKPIGNDVRQGNITLPIIYALRDNKINSEIKKLLKKKDFSENDADRILKLINESEVIEIVRKKVFYYLIEAKRIASEIKGSVRRNGLVEVCDYLTGTIERN
ncbi:MAG: polyprenyl synthetase family protein [Actinomycetota bacterium]|nr:polyprenyl synthetase family protein [Actinomycetota bacterium]